MGSPLARHRERERRELLARAEERERHAASVRLGDCDSTDLPFLIYSALLRSLPDPEAAHRELMERLAQGAEGAARRYREEAARLLPPAVDQDRRATVANMRRQTLVSELLGIALWGGAALLAGSLVAFVPMAGAARFSAAGVHAWLVIEAVAVPASLALGALQAWLLYRESWRIVREMEEGR